MKLTNIFLYLVLLTCIISPVFANNISNTTPSTSDIKIERVTMYIYGDGYYINGAPFPSGTKIVAKDQFNSIIGKYTMRESGKIGKEFGGVSDNFEIGVWRNQSDKINRTTPIYITFYVNNNIVKNTLQFKQNDNVKFDFILQSPPPTPSPLPTTAVLPTITTIVTTQTPSSNITTITQPPQNTQPLIDINDNDIILYGLIGTIIIIVGILCAGIIISYAIDKTSRDDVISPEDSSRRK